MKNSFIFLACFGCRIYFAQQISHVDFQVKDKVVTVTYDLDSCERKTCVDVSFRFVDSAFNYIIPAHVKGDLYSVLPGKNKVIQWNILSDTSLLKGNYRAEVEITHIWSTKITNGPACAFLSMALPGWGDYLVDENARDQYIKPHWKTLAFAYSAYFSVKAFNDFRGSKQRYSDLRSQSELPNSSVDPAQLSNYNNTMLRDKHTFIVAASVTAGIWLSDVLYVAYKGRQNRERQTHHPILKQTIVYVNPVNPGLGLVRNF